MAGQGLRDSGHGRSVSVTWTPTQWTHRTGFTPADLAPAAPSLHEPRLGIELPLHLHYLRGNSIAKAPDRYHPRKRSAPRPVRGGMTLLFCLVLSNARTPCQTTDVRFSAAATVVLVRSWQEYERSL